MHLTENPQGFSEVGTKEQLLIAIVVLRLFILVLNIRLTPPRSENHLDFE